jgi:hypothetical protein
LRSASYGAALYTTHPGGAVHEFGGTIAPKGTPITITADRYAEQAGQQQADRVADAAEARVDRALQKHRL